MRDLNAYEKARKYIKEHSGEEKAKKGGPCITISRQTGIGAEKISESLVSLLEAKMDAGYSQWGYFDKNLINKVIEDHNLPENLDRYFEESYIIKEKTFFSEMLGLHPSKIELLNKTAITIRKLAQLGNVIIVGRGAHFITSGLPASFHIRLVSPVNKRIRQVIELYGKSYAQACEFIKEEDEARRNFIKKYFHKDIDDPLNYHIVINTDLLTFEETAETLAALITRKFPQFFKKAPGARAELV